MIGFLSDKGNVRELNEDYLGQYCCENFSLYIVADGMGGHNAGEVASKFAAEGIIDFIKENYGIISTERLLRDSILDVNYKIYKLSVGKEELSGMGTTVTAVLVAKDFIQVANVGDSSCFGINDKGIKKITKDHSLVQELVDNGSITEEEAKNHPRKNIITRAIGTNISVGVDIFELEKGVYKKFLLCTDGLANDLDEEEIWKETINSDNLQLSCEKLVQTVKTRGGRDNITVLVFGGEN